jgi:hypothetical protein
MRVNTTSSEITVNAKYRGRVALCKWGLVAGPWYRGSRKTTNEVIYDRGKYRDVVEDPWGVLSPVMIRLEKFAHTIR